ncbi:uncharacterized protein LOC131679862 [Topomyia yanbarensis]|uniref:uncharacterized protein LOC131679862 n=1 Tax=Topomyia yanbarensis TaxID=2498891 RepID=UPI00273A95C7|nr:uncharacterized protein LOC131679862 [Topomyia yanbarensis]
MAGQKFFHGLTEAMINRASDRPDRQKSSFYWPDEYQEDPQEAYKTSSRRQSTASSTPSKGCASPASELDTGEVIKQQRHRGNVRSNIQFSDDCDSSFSQLERDRQTEKLRIAAFLREQCDDVSEAAKTRRQNTLKSNFHFYDFDDTPDGKSAQSPPPKPTNGYQRSAPTPDPEDPLRSSPLPNGNGGTTRRQQYSPASSEYHYSARYTGSYEDFEDDRSFKSNDFNYGNFSPPGTPSGGEVPEYKRNSQRHLRSSINFHNGAAMADDEASAERKPVTVRDSATGRVGVGLPNL